ncbi:MAG TPA: carboxypeptidase-like regulatory domain-containing protein [Pyrinomonadaceae bacterium]|jgi:hypothetical protein
MRAFLVQSITALALFVACGLCAVGQTPTGALAGTVTDPSGAVVAGASVTVRSDDTGQEFNAQTADNGTFNVPALASGNYTVTITAQGFKKAVARQVKVAVGTPSSINVALEIGEVTDVVTITGAGGELLQTQTATVGQTITGRQITDLPFTSRDALDLVTLLPGTATVGRPRQSSVNGLPKGALSISIDGVDAQDNLLKSSDGFFTFIRPRIDAIDEVTISTATPGAESAGDGAVQIKFVTRGGSNDFNGSLYWYHRNPSLNANYWFNNALLPEDPVDHKAPRTRVLLNQYGARVGGPIRIPGLFDGRDKAFFFVNYEEYRLPERTSRTRTILSAPATTGLFQYVTSTGEVRSRNVLDLAAAAGLPATIDPTVGSLLTSIRATLPQGGVSPVAGQPNTERFTFINPGGQDRKFPTVRLDWNVTKNQHLENTWNYQVFRNGVDFLNNADPAFPGFANFGGQDSNRWSNSTALRSTITPNLINEARLALVGGISLFRGDVTAEQFANQGGFNLNFNNVSTAFGLSNVTAGTPSAVTGPGVSLTGYSINRRNSPTKEFMDTVTWVKGTHSVNFGGNFKRIALFNLSVNQLVPFINFGVDTTDTAVNNAITNNSAAFPGASAGQRAQAAALYALLTGRVTAVSSQADLSEGSDQRYTLNGPLTQRAQQDEFGVFAQDAWRYRPNLTLNYGLRWQYSGPYTVDNNTFAEAGSFADLYGVSGLGNIFRPGTLTGRVPRFVGVPKGYQPYKADKNNFAPSVGLAYSPDWKAGLLNRAFGSAGQSVLRAGFSVAYVREGTNVLLSVTGGNPGGTIDATRSIALGNLPVGTLLRNRADLAPPTFQSTPAYPLLATAADSINVFAPNLRSGYVPSWTFGFQRELTKDMVFEARYVGNRGIKLWRQYNINEINTIENGFTAEYLRAQANLRANQAFFAATDPRRNSFAFTNAPGSQPLPVLFAYFLNSTNTNPNCTTVSATNPNCYLTFNAAGSTVTGTAGLFGNATLVTQLSPLVPNIIGFATNVNGSAARRANAAAAGLPLNYFQVNPTVQGGAFVVDNGGRSSYDGLVLELRRRLAGGLLLQGSYTWSKSLTDMYTVSSVVNSQYATLRNPALSKTASAFDIRHAFKVNWIYELPFGRGRQFLGDVPGWANHLVGGWEWHGAARLQSGAPFNYGNVQLVGMTRKELQQAVEVRKTTQCDSAGRNCTAVVYYLPDDIINNTIAAFNPDPTSATGFSSQFGVPHGRFIAPPGYGGCVQQFAGQCGFSNLVLYGPRFLKVDMNIVKKIHFTERMNLELRGEFLNAINNVAFRVGGWAADSVAFTATTNPGGLSRTDFGQLGNGTAYQDTSTTNDPGGRLVQLVIRLNF